MTQEKVETEGRKVAIVGSRKFKDPRMLAEAMDPMKPACVISGGADGADRIGVAWARRKGIETLEFLPQHKKYKHPYHHRNRLIAEACDVLVAFWNGRSSGTKYTIEYARRIGKPVIVPILGANHDDELSKSRRVDLRRRPRP